MKNSDYRKGLQILHLCDLVDPAGDHRAIADQARTIRIPCTWSRRSTSSSVSTGSLCRNMAATPRPDEIAREMGISEEKVREIIKIAQEPVSLETPIGEEDDSHLGRSSSKTRMRRRPRRP